MTPDLPVRERVSPAVGDGELGERGAVDVAMFEVAAWAPRYEVRNGAVRQVRQTTWDIDRGVGVAVEDEVTRA